MLKTIFLTLIAVVIGFTSEPHTISVKEQKQELLHKLNKSFRDFDNKKVFKLYQKLAKLYTENGEYYKAVRYYELALKLYLTKENQSNKVKVSLYHDIGYCYKKIGNNFKTFKYTYLATKLATKTYGKNSKITKNLKKDIEQIQSRLIASSIY